MHKIFIVEDDNAIAESLFRHLSAWGFSIACAQDFNHVLAELASFDPQLVLLDITLPFFNGYHWCAELRKVSSVPVVFISSASDNMDIIMAMNMGGDDFIPKPFDLNVLTSKIRALLRRTYDFGGQTELWEHRGAILNASDMTVSYDGQTAALTKNEHKILLTLLENKGKAVTRDKLMTALWQTDNYVDENTLTVNIARLRQKLAGIGLEAFIVTKKGVGYIVE